MCTSVGVTLFGMGYMTYVRFKTPPLQEEWCGVCVCVCVCVYVCVCVCVCVLLFPIRVSDLLCVGGVTPLIVHAP